MTDKDALFLRVNGQGHRLGPIPRTTVLDALLSSPGRHRGGGRCLEIGERPGPDTRCGRLDLPSLSRSPSTSPFLMAAERIAAALRSRPGRSARL